MKTGNGVRLVAADMDHTLLTERGELPPRFEEVVTRLDERGIEFCAASGRPLYTLEALFPRVKDRMSFICDNGALVRRRGTTLSQSLLDKEAAAALARFAREEGAGVPVLCALDSAYIDRKDAEHEKFFRAFYSRITITDSIERTAREADTTKFTVYFPKHDSKTAYETRYAPRFGGVFSVTLSDTVWIDVMNSGVDKGRGMRLLAEALDAGPDNMMAFGDSYNDIPMFNAVKYSYVVANACADMKTHAAFTAPANDEFGVARVINKELL